MRYTIYQTVNKINGKIYIGKHQTENPNDTYLGSGIALRNAIKKYGVESIKKRTESRRGFKLSAEARQKISEANRKRVVSEETKRKIAEKAKGRKHSEETKKKLSEIQAKKRLARSSEMV